jgi:H+/gluconate symporter-like permease
MSNRESTESRDILCGVGWAIVLNIGFFLGYLRLRPTFFERLDLIVPNLNFVDFVFSLPLAFIGIFQVIYLLPLYYHFRKKKKYEVCKGIVTGAMLILMLTGSCGGAFVNFNGNGSLFSFIGAAIAILSIPIGFLGIWLGTRDQSDR